MTLDPPCDLDQATFSRSIKHGPKLRRRLDLHDVIATLSVGIVARAPQEELVKESTWCSLLTENQTLLVYGTPVPFDARSSTARSRYYVAHRGPNLFGAFFQDELR